MFVCTGCTAAGEGKCWEVWLNLFKCTFEVERLKVLSSVGLAKVCALAWGGHLGTARRAYGELVGKPFEGRRPSAAPFGRFGSFGATEAVCFSVKARARGSLKLETCQMRVSSRVGSMFHRGGNVCVWFARRGRGEKLEMVRKVNEVWFWWFVGEIAKHECGL
ncbi:MAG: hypothetical protein ACEY26_01125 [Candidatus Hodgkinia cicadicola]